MRGSRDRVLRLEYCNRNRLRAGRVETLEDEGLFGPTVPAPQGRGRSRASGEEAAPGISEQAFPESVRTNSSYLTEVPATRIGRRVRSRVLHAPAV